MTSNPQTEQPKTRCLYVSPEDHCCTHAPTHGRYCIFHSGHDTETHFRGEPSPVFQREFDYLVNVQDGNWHGFYFPAGTKFPEIIDFSIDARWANLDGLSLEKINFRQRVDFSNAIFHGEAAFRSVSFLESVQFDQTKFDGLTTFMNVVCKAQASFYRAEFSERTILRINFSSTANFSESVFRGGATFAGWRSLTLQVSTGTFSWSGNAIAIVKGGESNSWTKDSFDRI